MSDSAIRGNYQIIDTSGMNKTALQSKGINDLHSTKDNVLDISDLSRLKEELTLNPKDESKIKFVKIGENQYIDLSNPEQRAELISKLKGSILEKGQVKGSFSKAGFEANTGIVLSFEKSNEVGSSISKSTQIMSNITKSIYNNNYNNPKIFKEITGSINEQIKELDAELKTLKADPVKNKAEISKLENIRNLAVSLRDVYQLIDNSNKPVTRKQMQQISEQLMTKIRSVTPALEKVKGNDIGVNNYLNIANTLEDLTVLAEGYSTHAAIGNASNDLSRFTLQSYERIREIKAKERVRPNETPDMTGALQSYANDSSDMAEFMRQISKVSANINSYGSKEEFINAMLKSINAKSLSKVPGGFADSVKNLAAGKWEQKIALEEIRRAREKVNEGQNNIASANQNLQTVIGTKNADGSVTEGLLQKAGKLYSLSEEKRFNHNETEARQLLSQVKIESQNIQTHMREYERLKNKGLGNLQEAQSHLALANAAAGRAQSHAEKVLNGRFAKELGPQAKAIIDTAKQIKAEADSIMSDIKRLKDSVAKTDKVAGTVKKESDSLDLRVESRQLLDKNIDEIRKSVSEEVKNARDQYNNPASKELVDFLSNPDKPVTPEQRENLLNELKGLMDTNPKIAQVYAEKLTVLKDEMTKIIAQKAGNDPVLAMSLKNEMIDGLFASQAGVMYDAATATFKPDESERMVAGGLIEKNYMQPLQKWVLEARGEVSEYMLKQNDEDIKKSFRKFDDTVKNNPEMQEKYQEFLTNHPHSGDAESVPMSLVFDKGFIMNFDVKMVKDTKTGEYCIFSPYDGGVYKGNSPEAAMKTFADGAGLGDGKLNYKDTKGNIVSTRVKAPESSFGKDLAMGGAGLLGGILLFVPEPTLLTKVAAGGLITASSAYFMHKGGTELYNLYQTERMGWNKETFFASLDVATGMLGVLDGVGVMLQATKTGATVLKTSAALAEGTSDATRLGTTGKTALSEAEKLSVIQSVVKRYVEVTASKGFNMTNLSLNLSNATLSTASRIYDITKMDISDGEKAKKIAEALASTLVPLGIAAASHAVMRSKTQSEFIEVASKQLDNVTTNINQAKLNPITSESLVESLSQLKDLESKIKIKSEAFGNPKLAEVGLQRIEQLKTQIQNLMKQSEVINTILKDPEVQRLGKAIDEANIKVEGIEGQITSGTKKLESLKAEIDKNSAIRKDPKATEAQRQQALENLKKVQPEFAKTKKDIADLETTQSKAKSDRQELIDERETHITKIAPKQEIPMGFKDQAEFQKTIDIYKDNQYIKQFATDEPVIGVRGSSIYGASPIKGTAFGPESDLDVFIVSDNLFNEGLKRLADKGITEGMGRSGFREYVRNGYLTDKAMKEVFPDFVTSDKAVKSATGRDSGMRVMSREGFEKIKTGKEVLGK